ncbi:MAG: iron ABC transporter permease [Bryobacteraceae bacterium]
MATEASRRSFHVAIAVCGAFLAVSFAISILAGASSLDFGRALAGESPHYEVLVHFRLPRVLLAMLGGGCLALAGALFQALLRDALATPYTTGVSSGAALGAVIMISLGWSEIAGLPAIWIGAFAGAGAVLALVTAIATEGRRVSSFTLLLAGVALNSICGSLILFLHSFANLSQSFSIARWLMGGIEPVRYGTLAVIASMAGAVCAVVIAQGREWNAVAAGEEWAAARGVNVRRLTVIGFLAGSFLTGLITAFTGPVGFIGLIVPHALRLRLDPDHRLLLPCSFLGGAAFLALCDGFARVIVAPAELPVGVVTALLGGPFFIWLLRSRRKVFWL